MAAKEVATELTKWLMEHGAEPSAVVPDTAKDITLSYTRPDEEGTEVKGKGKGARVKESTVRLRIGGKAASTVVLELRERVYEAIEQDNRWKVIGDLLDHLFKQIATNAAPHPASARRVHVPEAVVDLWERALHRGHTWFWNLSSPVQNGEKSLQTRRLEATCRLVSLSQKVSISCCPVRGLFLGCFWRRLGGGPENRRQRLRGGWCSLTHARGSVSRAQGQLGSSTRLLKFHVVLAWRLLVGVGFYVGLVCKFCDCLATCVFVTLFVSASVFIRPLCVSIFSHRILSCLIRK